MRLSATVPGTTVEAKLRAVREIGLTGTDLWFELDTPIPDPAEVRRQFEAAGVVLAQVSCYVNLECAPGELRERQMAKLREVIAFAGAAGARCVVSGSGHMHPDKPTDVFAAHPDNWTPAAMDRLAASCREASAWAEAAGTRFGSESWVLLTLNSPRAMRELLDRVDHPAFGVLFDPVNLMNLDVYFDNGQMIREAFELFGDRILAVHAKDTILVDSAFTYHMKEAHPGQGTLDYATLLRCLDVVPDATTPLHIEHLPRLEDVIAARDHIRQVAGEVGVAMI